jgi:hypothetical protein
MYNETGRGQRKRPSPNPGWRGNTHARKVIAHTKRDKLKLILIQLFILHRDFFPFVLSSRYDRVDSFVSLFSLNGAIPI